MSSKLLKGAFILTLGSVLSKVLGLFYVIPFNKMVGDSSGGDLYQHSYVLYTIFISLATAGMPLAVSKFISKYNALEEYAISQRLFKSTMKIMVVTGFVSFLLLYMIAPFYGDFVTRGNTGLKAAEVTAVIRAVSFALILIPPMSLARGYFQGQQIMEPTAISQVVEQIVRIVFLLTGVFIVLNVLHGKMVTAISFATFAATVGALGGVVVLLWYWRKYKPMLDEQLRMDKGQMSISLPQIYKEVFISSIPFIFVGIAMPIFQEVDSLTYSKAMVSIGLDHEVEGGLSVLNLYVQKLVVIPMTLATAFSMALVPAVTKAYVNNNTGVYTRQLNQTFQILLFVTIPAVVGMSVLADPVYSSFYVHDSFGASILQAYAPTAILFALFSVSAAVLQGINQQKYTVLSLLVGLLIKMSLNIPFIQMFQTKGAVYATTLGFLAACILNLFVIRYFTQFSYRLVLKRSILICIFSAIMALVVWGIENLLFLLGFQTESRWQAIIMTIISVGFGGLVYAAFSLKSKLAHRLFGSRIDRLAQKLGVKAKG
ncbi:putative polysaccharide biosynthesis protein [Peribacillus loiseleuriae]|uniref:putative polysaccharide biosynthesis protein n=1 Tax=Peribacillus loiseleuriae TaxID=1679170 RepID=UPI003D055945